MSDKAAARKKFQGTFSLHVRGKDVRLEYTHECFAASEEDAQVEGASFIERSKFLRTNNNIYINVHHVISFNFLRFEEVKG